MDPVTWASNGKCSKNRLDTSKQREDLNRMAGAPESAMFFLRTRHGGSVDVHLEQ
jgi:hypothetical protein